MKINKSLLLPLFVLGISILAWFLLQNVRVTTAVPTTVNWTVTGMACQSCAHKIDTALSQNDQLQNIHVQKDTKTVTFSYTNDTPDVLEWAKQTIQDLGYQIDPPQN